MSIGDRIKQRRILLGMTQPQLAEKMPGSKPDVLGKTKGAVSQWENDLTVPLLAQAIRLAEELGVSMDWLFRDHLDAEERQMLDVAQRIRDLPPMLRAKVIRILEDEEATVRQLPKGTFDPPIDEDRLDQAGFGQRDSERK